MDTREVDRTLSVYAYWRAVNYLTVGYIHLKDNPLLEVCHFCWNTSKLRPLGQLGYDDGVRISLKVHLNRLISFNDLDMICDYRVQPWRPGPGRGHLIR